jgi:hypothetical protein
MRKDDIEGAIRQTIDEPTTITAEDLEPPVIAHCGEELVGD